SAGAMAAAPMTDGRDSSSNIQGTLPRTDRKWPQIQQFARKSNATRCRQGGPGRSQMCEWGGGLEWMFAPGWSVFGQYNYMDFGRKDILFTAAPGTVGLPSINSTRLTMQPALVGANHKFNFGGGPVVAKY